MIGNDTWYKCTVCGREGRVGRCCGDETRTPLNVKARIEQRTMREYEFFLDTSYYGMWCVRDKNDRSFESPLSFHFEKKEDAEIFFRLIKIAR